MPEPITPTADAAKDKKEVVAPVYTETEKKYYGSLVRLLCNARTEREKIREEFDDMSYSKYYDSNRRADLGYLRKKKNKEDKRVSTGLTREKDNTLLSVFLKFDFKALVMAFDQENFLLNELGHQMSGLVEKTREQEIYQETRYFLYREYISQGDVFAEEIYDEPLTVEKTFDKNMTWKPGMPIESYKVKEQTVKGIGIAKTRLVEGKKVYFGDLRIENAEDQPFIFTHEIISRHEAETIYGNWARWENVPFSVQTVEPMLETDSGTKTWGFYNTGTDDVSVIKFQRKGANEYMILLNGVMMLPVGYALTNISPSGEYTLTQGKFEGIANFSYSKGQPAKTKFDEATLNEFYTLMIGKMQQSLKPPMGNTTGKTLNQSIFIPGKITPNVKPKELFPLFNSQGPTTAEFSFFNAVKEIIEAKSINKTFEGQEQGRDVTAFQLDQEKQQQMLRLGTAMDGIINFERRLVWKRIYTILTKYTDPIEEETDQISKNIKSTFRTFTFDTELDNGEKGVKIYHFTNEEFPTQREQQELEKDLALYYDKPVQVILLDAPLLRAMKLVWWVVITPTERHTNSSYQRLVFVSLVREAIEIFGPTLNVDYVKQRYANIIGEDPSKFFMDTDLLDSLSAMQKSGPQGGGAPAEAVEA